MDGLSGWKKFAADTTFGNAFRAAKQTNKLRLATWVVSHFRFQPN